jgi:AraC-like DNA-binding protein
MQTAHAATQPPAFMPSFDVSMPAAPPRPREVVFNGRGEWQAGLQEHLLPMQCLPADPQAVKCNAVIAHLCGNRYAELRVDASRLVRRDIDIEDDPCELVKVMWQLAGRIRIHQGPHCSTLDTGAWTICDAAREYAVEFEQSARCMLMLVPRSQCAGWLDAVDALAALALPACGPARVAQGLLAMLLRDAAELDARSERALHDSVIALVERGLKAELEKRGTPKRTRQPVDCARIQSYVLDHVADKTLMVERVAAVFGLSRRTLYNLFAPLGITPHAFIQRAKLDRAVALLSDEASRDLPIVRIAEQCGFADAAHFSRAFHARFGSAPHAWRSRSN